jgi:SAM-dependent methyltransferase
MTENKITSNDYSPTWFEVFLESIQPVQTESEIEFLARSLPNPPYLKVLDLCCGLGRHSLGLANKGYQVTGVDINEAVLEKARKYSGDSVEYLKHDMRELNQLHKPFDAVVSLWQSFGYFDNAVNEDILKQIGRILNPKGRFILDIYHRGFFERHQGSRQFEKNDLVITETKVMNGHRLIIDLQYAGRETDRFDWHLYTPEEIVEIAVNSGLKPLVSCTGFDENVPSTSDNPRMQLVFEKTG